MSPCLSRRLLLQRSLKSFNYRNRLLKKCKCSFPELSLLPPRAQSCLSCDKEEGQCVPTLHGEGQTPSLPPSSPICATSHNCSVSASVTENLPAKGSRNQRPQVGDRATFTLPKTKKDFCFISVSGGEARAQNLSLLLLPKHLPSPEPSPCLCCRNFTPPVWIVGCSSCQRCPRRSDASPEVTLQGKCLQQLSSR